MKNKQLKNYLKFGILLFGISCLFYTCQKDDEFTTSSNTEIEQADLPQGNNQSRISLQTIDFNIAQHKNRLLEKLIELAPQEQDPYAMVAHSETQDHILLQGLNVSQDSVVFASFGNKHSYTFATWRDQESPLLENLVLTYDNVNTEDNNEYTAYLVQYDFEQGTIKTHNVEDASLIVAFSDVGCGWSIQVTPCSSGQHNAGNPSTWDGCTASVKPIMVMTNNLCDNGITGGDTTIVIYDGNIDTGTGGDDDPPPVDDSPNLGNGDDGNTTVDPDVPVGGDGNNDTTQDPDSLDDIDMVTQPIDKPRNEIPDPCVILTLATNDTGINNAIDNLKTKTNEEKEHGYEIKYSYNENTRQYQYETVYKTSGDDFTVALNIGGFIQGGAHNHPKDGVAIPSWRDLKWLYELEKESYGLNNNKAFSIIVAKDKESDNEDDTITYAITINDFNALQGQINTEMNQNNVQEEPDPEKKLDIIMKKFGKKFKNIEDDNNALQKKFLQTFANYGIDLYKKDDNSNTWKKLKLVNNNPIEEPCNI